MCVGIVRDTMAMKVCERLVDDGLLDAKKMGYSLDFVPLSSENRNPHLEIL
jgi:hypothetical protein